MNKGKKRLYRKERDLLIAESMRLEQKGEKEAAKICTAKASVYSAILNQEAEEKRRKKAEKLIKRKGAAAIRRAARIGKERKMQCV